MAREHVELTGDKQTLLVTLYGKALDSRAAQPILGDTYARDVVDHLDYDFSRLHVPRGAEVSLPVRAKHFDNWTREFLASHPRATVLHLGCGLDSRVLRVDPEPGVRWYDVDYPEVIELRRRLYPGRAGSAANANLDRTIGSDGTAAASYEMIGSSVTDLRWLDQIPTGEPVIVVAEGLVEYLRPDAGLELFRLITERFPSGALVFDACSKLFARMIRLFPAARTADVHLSWTFDDPRDLVRAIPRLELVEDVSFLALPELAARLPRARAAMLRFLTHFRWARRSIRHLRYRF
ncbi:MAG: class I SAM-dependent methyltransferase [Kofleriaceae bacterium]|nr:class I SAM-dependent methyltransferase [Kofleriaceae bacterium]